MSHNGLYYTESYHSIFSTMTTTEFAPNHPFDTTPPVSAMASPSPRIGTVVCTSCGVKQFEPEPEYGKAWTCAQCGAAL
jgi:hypothetical protein